MYGGLAGFKMARADRMAEAAEAQMVVSGVQERGFMPMPEMIMLTGRLFGARVARTAGGERMSPWVMWRWLERVEGDRPLERRMEVSLEGVRATVGGILVFGLGV